MTANSGKATVQTKFILHFDLCGSAVLVAHRVFEASGQSTHFGMPLQSSPGAAVNIVPGGEAITSNVDSSHPASTVASPLQASAASAVGPALQPLHLQKKKLEVAAYNSKRSVEHGEEVSVEELRAAVWLASNAAQQRKVRATLLSCALAAQYAPP